jgi:hypothetical protein
MKLENLHRIHASSSHLTLPEHGFHIAFEKATSSGVERFTCVHDHKTQKINFTGVISDQNELKELIGFLQSQSMESLDIDVKSPPFDDEGRCHTCHKNDWELVEHVDNYFGPMAGEEYIIARCKGCGSQVQLLILIR